MPTQDFPTLQGDAPSWADIETTFSVYEGKVLDMADLAGVKWGRKVEIGEQRGTGGRLRARTGGRPSYEGSMTIYRSAYLAFMRALMEKAPTDAAGRKRVGKVAFDILIQFTPEGTDDVHIVNMKGCRLMEDGEDSKDSADPNQIECALHVMEIVNIIDGVEVLLV